MSFFTNQATVLLATRVTPSFLYVYLLTFQSIFGTLEFILNFRICVYNVEILFRNRYSSGFLLLGGRDNNGHNIRGLIKGISLVSKNPFVGLIIDRINYLYYLSFIKQYGLSFLHWGLIMDFMKDNGFSLF